MQQNYPLPVCRNRPYYRMRKKGRAASTFARGRGFTALADKLQILIDQKEAQ